MASFSNREILAAVIVKWAEPLTATVINGNIGRIPFLDAIQNKVLSSGWVSPSWRIGNDLAPFATTIADALVRPMLANMMQNVEDAAIPALAHKVVDTAIEKGELSIFDGNISFDADDLGRLKRLLNANLPAASLATYQVKGDET